MQKKLKFEDKTFEINLNQQGENYFAVFNGREYSLQLEKSNEHLKIFVDGEPFFIKVIENGLNEYLVKLDNIYELEISEEKGISNGLSQVAKLKTSKEKKIKAPMPGKVVAIKVKENDTVKKNQILIILEAMKMENEITSPVNGKLAELKVKEGDTVNTGDTMCKIMQT